MRVQHAVKRRYGTGTQWGFITMHTVRCSSHGAIHLTSYTRRCTVSTKLLMMWQCNAITRYQSSLMSMLAAADATTTPPSTRGLNSYNGNVDVCVDQPCAPIHCATHMPHTCGCNKSAYRHAAPASPSYRLNGRSGVLTASRNALSRINIAICTARCRYRASPVALCSTSCAYADPATPWHSPGPLRSKPRCHVTSAARTATSKYSSSR